MLSMASWRGSASGSANRHDLQVVDAPANGQHSPHPFISDDARQRRPDRIYTLDEIQVIHVDRRMLDTDQHLACGRCWRFGKVGKFEDDSRLAESSDLHGTHSAPPALVMAEFDEVATGERTPGLLQAATRRETAEIDRREAETLDELFDEGGRFGMVPRDEDHATSSTEAADAPRPSPATLSLSASEPRRLLKTTSWPLASASRPNASATAPAPIVPNFMPPPIV